MNDHTAKRLWNHPHLVGLALGARIPLVSAPVPVSDGNVELDGSDINILENLNDLIIAVDQRDVASLSEHIPDRARQTRTLIRKKS